MPPNPLLTLLSISPHTRISSLLCSAPQPATNAATQLLSSLSPGPRSRRAPIGRAMLRLNTFENRWRTYAEPLPLIALAPHLLHLRRPLLNSGNPQTTSPGRARVAAPSLRHSVQDLDPRPLMRQIRWEHDQGHTAGHASRPLPSVLLPQQDWGSLDAKPRLLFPLVALSFCFCAGWAVLLLLLAMLCSLPWYTGTIRY
jgi:hypothetical protein